MESTWPPNELDSLEEICIRFLAKNLHILARRERKHCCHDSVDSSISSSVDPEPCNQFQIRPGVFLPKAVCDQLFDMLIEEHGPLTDDIVAIFSNNQAAQLSHADLRHSDVTVKGLSALVCQPIVDLSMHCDWSCLPIIRDLSKTLLSLRLQKTPLSSRHSAARSANQALQAGAVGSAVDPDSERFMALIPPVCYEDEDIFKMSCPKLRKLVLQELELGGTPEAENLVTCMIRPLRYLTHLSLASCYVKLEQLDCLTSLSGLVWLNLSNIPIDNFSAVLKCISPLRRLKHLDLSQGDEDIIPVIYQNSDNYLKEIMSLFPHLMSLDISGTNLAGFDPPEYVSHRMEPGVKKRLSAKVEEEKCSIPGLEERHLEFLGLLGCAYAACSRNNIPAKRVTGDANPDQVLLAVQVYVDNHWLLIKALNDLFNLFRFSTVPNHRFALEAILAAMKNYPYDNSVQIAGSASLFYIAKGDQKRCITYKHKRSMISLLLKAMSNHCAEQTMMRNACLTLCHLNLPYDVMFCYEQLVRVLLGMLKHDFRDEFIHRLGIFLLNCLACQVDGKEKQLVGNMGAVETMLTIISRKLMGDDCDDVLEVAWSTLWNVTDETPSNCQKFIAMHGMQLFLQCLQKFSDKAELLRNMMGLMGNIAEVDWLRPELMKENYVSVFSELLDSTSDGIEVSYNACGVLAHLVYDGASSWLIEKPSCAQVLNRMEAAINRWPLESKRNINYRSFMPILRLVGHFETPQVQHWAVWALCNLTWVSPEKYCCLLEREGGRQILQKVASDPRPYKRIRELAQRTLHQLDSKEVVSISSDNEGDEVVVEMHESDEDEEEEEAEEGEQNMDENEYDEDVSEIEDFPDADAVPAIGDDGDAV